MLIYIGAIVAILLLALLYHYIPSRRIFFCFFLVLCAASAIVFFVWPSPHHSNDIVISQQEREERQQQQQIFAVWYEGCQKDIDDLDHNWQRYHKILSDFHDDIISIQTTYLRLAQLEKDSQSLEDRIAGRTPPLELNDYCYDQSIELVRKTHDYADAQHRAIALTRAAADPANLHTDDQEEQSRMLQAVMIRESPSALFIADEIAAIRSYLALPEETADGDNTDSSQKEN
ncbi:hypothetical protein [Mitsuokella sp.]|uniref:hypothetical protein n=1 Tax=Mitsuokella sp. TaxID=2049034 RepID=UPI003D7C60A0